MIRTERSPAAGLGEERALEVGIQALQFLAGDPVLLDRFLALSGLDARDLRAAAAQPAFFAGILDFMLAHENTLDAFCRHADLPAERVSAARRALHLRFGTGEE